MFGQKCQKTAGGYFLTHTVNNKYVNGQVAVTTCGPLRQLLITDYHKKRSISLVKCMTISVEWTGGHSGLGLM